MTAPCERPRRTVWSFLPPIIGYPVYFLWRIVWMLLRNVLWLFTPPVARRRWPRW